MIRETYALDPWTVWTVSSMKRVELKNLQRVWEPTRKTSLPSIAVPPALSATGWWTPVGKGPLRSRAMKRSSPGLTSPVGNTLEMNDRASQPLECDESHKKLNCELED
jgi:hypothetical protein